MGANGIAPLADLLTTTCVAWDIVLKLAQQQLLNGITLHVEKAMLRSQLQGTAAPRSLDCRVVDVMSVLKDPRRLGYELLRIQLASKSMCIPHRPLLLGDGYAPTEQWNARVAFEPRDGAGAASPVNNSCLAARTLRRRSRL